MDPDATVVFKPDASFAEVVAAYEQAALTGTAPEPDHLVARYPALAQELTRFFADRTGREAQTVAGQSTSSAMPIEAANKQLFGDYEMIREIARGGMGAVFKARQLSLNRIVALKMILAGQLASAHDLQRFQREAEAVANLDHPNIVPVYDVGEHAGQHYFTMKLIEGDNLTSVSRDPRKFTPLQIAQLMATIARAVHYAHERGILHRDLKPSNILLDSQGQPYVTDFGLAKRIEGDAGQTRTGVILGTPSYMAPEQARSEKVTTTAVDVYSLGAILYELLTGRPPFRADTSLDTILQVLEREPEPPRKLSPHADRDLETICLKCLEKEPRRRYASALALAEELERISHGVPIAARPVSFSERGIKWTRRHPAVATLLAALCLATVGGSTAVTLLWLRAEERGRLAREERDKAQRRFLLVREAVDQYYTHVSESKKLKLPGLELLRGELLESACHFYEKLVEEEGDDLEIAAERGRAYGRLALLYRTLGNYEQAEAAGLQALSIHRQMTENEPAVARHLADLGAVYFQLGVLFSDVGRTQEAQQSLDQAVTIQRELASQDSKEPVNRMALARSLSSLGIVFRRIGHKEQAETAYTEARGIRQQLVQSYPDVASYQFDLAASDHNLVLMYQSMELFPKAEAACREGLGIIRRLVDAYPEEPEYQHDLAGFLSLNADLCRQAHQYEDAKRSYEAAQATLQKLTATHPDVPDYQSELALAYNNLGVLYFQSLHRYDDARAAYREALTIQDRLTHRYPTALQYTIDLAGGFCNFGHFLNQLGQPKSAIEWYDKAEQVCRQVLQQESRHVVGSEYLRNTYEGRAEVREQLGRREEALKDCDAALAISTRLSDDVPSSALYKSLVVRGQMQRARLLYGLNRAAEADECFRAGFAIEQVLVLAYPTELEYAVRLGGDCCNWGNLHSGSPETESARRWYDQAIETLQAVLKQSPAHRRGREFLRNTYVGRAAVWAKSNRFADAATDRQLAVRLDESLCHDYPTSLDYALHLGASYGDVAAYLVRAGKAESALEWSDKAVMTLQGLVEKHPQEPHAREYMRTALSNRIRILGMLGRKTEAEQESERLRKLGPKVAQ